MKYLEDVYFIETDTLFWIHINMELGEDKRKFNVDVKRIYFENIPKELWKKIEGIK